MCGNAAGAIPGRPGVEPEAAGLSTDCFQCWGLRKRSETADALPSSLESCPQYSLPTDSGIGRYIEQQASGTMRPLEIYMDDRAHPEGDYLNPSYFGHSVGHESCSYRPNRSLSRYRPAETDDP